MQSYIYSNTSKQKNDAYTHEKDTDTNKYTQSQINTKVDIYKDMHIYEKRLHTKLHTKHSIE